MSPLDSLKHLFTRPSGEARFDPVRNWLLLLVIVGIALLALLAWNVWAFQGIANGRGFGTSVGTNVSSKEIVPLAEIESIFATRAQEAKKYQSGGTTFTDPSL